MGGDRVHCPVGSLAYGCQGPRPHGCLASAVRPHLKGCFVHLLTGLIICRKGINSGAYHKISSRNFHAHLLALFIHKKFHLEDATDVISFMLHSFQHMATIQGCMFHSKCMFDTCGHSSTIYHIVLVMTIDVKGK